MISKTAFLAALPVSIALLAGTALPFEGAGGAMAGHELGDPAWNMLALLVLGGIVAVAGTLLLRAFRQR